MEFYIKHNGWSNFIRIYNIDKNYGFYIKTVNGESRSSRFNFTTKKEAYDAAFQLLWEHVGSNQIRD